MRTLSSNPFGWIGALVLAMTSFLPATLRAEAPKTLFIGDSITLGQGAHHPETERWTALVSKAQGWVEINEGKGGRPSSAMAEIKAIIEKRKSDPGITRLVIALGANDSRDPSPNIAEQVVHHLGETIDLAHAVAPGWQIILCGPYNVNREHLANKEVAQYREQNLTAIDAAVKKLAADRHLPFVEYLGVIPPGSLTVDGVHPDPAGYAAVAKIFLSSIPANPTPSL